MNKLKLLNLTGQAGKDVVIEAVDEFDKKESNKFFTKKPEYSRKLFDFIAEIIQLENETSSLFIDDPRSALMTPATTLPPPTTVTVTLSPTRTGELVC